MARGTRRTSALPRWRIAWRAGVTAGVTVIAAGCSSVTATSIVGAAFNAAMETAGLKEPAAARTGGHYRPLTLTLAAGEVLNATAGGESLALVVQIYQLRNGSAFSTLSYAQATDGDAARAALGSDLVAMREVTLLPGKTHRFDDPVPTEVKIVGIVALFRAPAANRWKFAFDRERSAQEGISVGIHACAMTIGIGELVNHGATAASRTLGGVRCT